MEGFTILVGILAIFGVVIFIIIKVHDRQENDERFRNTQQVLASRGESLSDYINVGTYVGGHPNIDDVKANLQCKKVGNQLLFYTNSIYYESIPELVIGFEIPIPSIRNISVEDETTIQQRITAGRLLLVGIFAFAWKKKEEKERTFVIIEWNDGRFDHSTTLLFIGSFALQKANKVRNVLIRLCRN